MSGPLNGTIPPLLALNATVADQPPAKAPPLSMADILGLS